MLLKLGRRGAFDIGSGLAVGGRVSSTPASTSQVEILTRDGSTILTRDGSTVIARDT